MWVYTCGAQLSAIKCRGVKFRTPVDPKAVNGIIGQQSYAKETLLLILSIVLVAAILFRTHRVVGDKKAPICKL